MVGGEGGFARHPRVATGPAGADGRPLEVLIVSLGSTEGLRRADEELRASLARAGAHVTLVAAREPRPMRTLMLTDLAWARAARAAAVRPAGARETTERSAGGGPLIIYSSVTAALLWPRAGAIRFDATATENRAGRHGLWQRPLERSRLVQAPLLLPWSEGSLLGVPHAAHDRALVVPVAIAPSGAAIPWGERDIAAITYAANPSKKGLDRVLTAWREVCPGLPEGSPRELVVAGTSERELRAARVETDGLVGVRFSGRLPQDEYRALLRRARVFVCAPRREDYGIAQLEALADGCMLVTTPAPGPYAALPIARRLDPRLVSEDLRGALRAALRDPAAGYDQRAQSALCQFSHEHVDRLVASELVPRLRLTIQCQRRRR